MIANTKDRVFGSTAQLLALAGRAGATPEGWAKPWLDESVPAMQGLTLREAAGRDDQMAEDLSRRPGWRARLAGNSAQSG